MNIADDFYYHDLTAIMIQETHIKGTDYTKLNPHPEKYYIYITPDRKKIYCWNRNYRTTKL